MSCKIEVNRDGRDPTYAAVVAAGGSVENRWNFEKLLAGRDAQVLARFDPRVEPAALEVVTAIDRALG